MKRFTSVITTISFLINTIANAAPISPIESYPAFKSLSNEIIKNLFIPEGYGSIVDRWGGGNSKKFIINIQDAHCNYEAQQNIAKILKILIMDYGIDLVGVEGAEGDLDLSQYGEYKDERAKEKALDIYAKKGYVTGSEYLNILKYNKLPFGIYGIEDGELYLENFIRFRESWGNIKEIDCFIGELAKIIEGLKVRTYPDELLEFTKKCDGYENNNISLTEWVRFLGKKKPAQMYIRGNQRNFILVLRAIRLEEGIDFEKVEKEREELIKWLEKNLPKEELEILVKKGLEYRLGKIPQVGYYGYLEKYIHTGNYNYLGKYINLMKIQSRINSDELFNEIEEVTYGIKKDLFQNEIQRKLDDTSYKIGILERLFHLRLSRKELGYYENNRDEFDVSKIIDFIKIQCGINNINIPHILSDASFIGKIKENLLPASAFYKLAMMRDGKLTENLLLRMDMENKNSAVIITGGFHTNGVKGLLRENGINYVVITPKITKAQPDNLYLSIMLDERIRYVRKADQGQYMIAPPEVIAPNGNGIPGLDMASFAGIREELKALIKGFMSGGIEKDEFTKRVEDIKLTEEEISMVKKVIKEIKKKNEEVGSILEDIFGLSSWEDEEETKKLLNNAKYIYSGDNKEGAIKLLDKLREIEDEVVIKSLVSYIVEDIRKYPLDSPQFSFIYFLLKEVLPKQKKNVIDSVLANIYRICMPIDKDTEDLRLRGKLLDTLNILINYIKGLGYEYRKETAEIVVRDLLERGRLRISIMHDIVSDISETEFERYFYIDDGIIYLKDGFYTRLKVERDTGFLKRLKGALDIYTKESFNLSNMKNIYLSMMDYNLIEDTLRILEEGYGNVEARIFTISILVEYGKRPSLLENCSRIIRIIDTIYKETDNQYYKEKLIGCIREITEIDNSLQDKEVLASLIKREMVQIIELINSIGIRLKEDREDFKKVRKEQLVLMKRMELNLEVLEILSKKALECPDSVSQAFGDSILGYMLELVEKSIKEKWDPNIQAEIISDLGYFIGIGHDKVFQWFLDRLEPGIEPEDRGNIIMNERDKILDIFGCNKINERAAYLILYRNHENWGLLKDIIYSQKIDIRFRIYAFTWYVLRFLEGEGNDIGEFQEMVNCLKDDAEGFVREVSKDSAKIERLVEDRILQDEEAKVYVMANFLMLKKYVFTDITAKGFIEIAKLISNTRVRGYWANANSNFIIGGRVLRMVNKKAFFPVIAHELMHNILMHEYRMYFGLNREIDIFHEFMADISCFATAEIIGGDPEEIMQELRYEHHLRDVQEGDYISLEGHKGARALLQTIMEAFKKEGIKIEWKTFLEKAMDTLRNKTIMAVSLMAVIGFMMMRYLEVKEEDATQRALEFSSEYHTPESSLVSQSKIPSGTEIGKIIRGNSEKGFVLGEGVISLALLSSIITVIFTWDHIGKLVQEPYIFALLGTIFAIVLSLSLYSLVKDGNKGSKARSRAPIAIKGTIIFFSAILVALFSAVGVIDTLYTLGPGLSGILIQLIPLGIILLLFVARNILLMIDDRGRGPKLSILILAFLISCFFSIGAPMAQSMDMKSPPTTLKGLLYTRGLGPEDKLDTALAIYGDVFPQELEGYRDIPIVLSPMTDAIADTNVLEEKKFDRRKIKIKISVPWMEGKLIYKPPTALYVAAVLRHEIQHIIETEGVSNVFEWWWAIHKAFLFGGEKMAFEKELELIKRYNEKYNMGIDISLYDEYDRITKTRYNIKYFRKRVDLLATDLLIMMVILLGIWKIFLNRICGDFIISKYKKLEGIVRKWFEKMIVVGGEGLDIENISKKLRVDKDVLVELSRDLGDEEKTNALREEFIRLVKEGGITNEEMKIIVEETERVVSVSVDGMMKGGVLINPEVLESFIIRVVLYLSIEKIKDKIRSEKPPECIEEFRGRLLEIAPDSNKVGQIIDELMGMTEYTFDRNGDKILLKADIYLKKILEIFKGDEGLKLSINKVRGYLYSRAGVKEPLPDSSIDGFRKGIENDLVSDLKTGKLIELSSNTIFLQDLELYVSDNRDWDLENLDGITLSIIKELIGRGQLVFTYDKKDKMEEFIKLLKVKGISEREITDWELYDKLVFIDVSGCKNYNDVRRELQRFFLSDLLNKRLISMVKRSSERFRCNNLRDRIILACREGEGIFDLYLMWKIAFIFGKLEDNVFSTDGMNIISKTFRNDMGKLLKGYYKGTDLINNINEIIDSMIEGFYLILPPVIPFIRDYYNALGIADNLIRKSV